MRPGAALIRLLVVCALAGIAGCTEPPTKEMNQAQGALDTARAAGAAEYAPEEFKAAEASLARSQQAVEERDYRQALNYALDARDRAQSSARQAADEKARVRTEADRALTTADTRLARTRERLGAAAVARLPQRSLADLGTKVAAAEQAVTDARSAFTNGDYRHSIKLASDVEAQLTSVTSEINAAMAAHPPRRTTRGPR